MQVELCDGETSRPLIANLSAAVYPPEVLSTIIWRDVTSARASRRVLVRDGPEVIAAAGLLWRQVSLDGSTVLLAGLGGVMTRPDRQRMGFGRVAVEEAMRAFVADAEPTFGLLFCEEKNVGFYARLGWARFHGKVVVEQPGGRIVYDLMQAMVLPLCGLAPGHGEIDLNGFPW